MVVGSHVSCVSYLHSHLLSGGSPNKQELLEDNKYFDSNVLQLSSFLKCRLSIVHLLVHVQCQFRLISSRDTNLHNLPTICISLTNCDAPYCVRFICQIGSRQNILRDLQYIIKEFFCISLFTLTQYIITSPICVSYILVQASQLELWFLIYCKPQLQFIAPDLSVYSTSSWLCPVFELQFLLP